VQAVSDGSTDKTGTANHLATTGSKLAHSIKNTFEHMRYLSVTIHPHWIDWSFEETIETPGEVAWRYVFRELSRIACLTLIFSKMVTISVRFPPLVMEEDVDGVKI
jgi:hypothetical protein